MKEYIVTGATGYVGFHLVEQLIEKGFKPVKILIRNKRALKRFSHLDINYAIGDITDIEFLEKEITENSVVFHLAGMIDISYFKRKLIYETNVEGTKNVVNACIKNKAEKLIYTSSTSAITPTKDMLPMVEPVEFNHKKVTGDYAKTKALSSSYVLSKAKDKKLNAVVCYPSAIIGPYDYNLSNLGKVVTDYINGKLKFYIKGKYNFIDVRDVVTGLINAYLYGVSGSGYLLTGETVDLKEMFKTINKIINKPKLPKKVPLFIVKLAVPFISLYNFIFKKQLIFTLTSLKILNQNSNFDNTKGVKELKLKPRSHEESFKDMIKWLYVNKRELFKVELKID